MTDEDIRKIIFTELATIAPEAEPSALSPTANVREALDARLRKLWAWHHASSLENISLGLTELAARQ